MKIADMEDAAMIKQYKKSAKNTRSVVYIRVRLNPIPEGFAEQSTARKEGRGAAGERPCLLSYYYRHSLRII